MKSPALGNRGRFPEWLSGLGLREFVALDLETTGLDAERERVIEVGLVRFRDGVEEARFEQLVDPGEPLDPFITDLTGLTDDDLRGQPQFSAIAGELLEFVGSAPIVGQNVNFDLEFVLAESERFSRNRRGENPFRFVQNEVLDTAQLARVFWPEWPRFSLAALSERFGVERTVAHRALEDARVAGGVLCCMVDSLPDRVWAEVTRDLTYLIEGTFDRSAQFFSRLATMSEGLAPPSDVVPHASRRADMEEVDLTGLPTSEEVFGPDGRLPKALRNYEPRPLQLQMAEAVQDALRENRILLCEAPTGTGKSLAYLVPAALWTLEAAREGRQVIVSSHTKALQEQLHRKEIPTVVDDLRIPVRSAVLKGRENYLCRRRLRNLIGDARTRLSDEDRKRLMPLVRWSATTTTGDITEMGGFQPRAAPWLWAQVCSDAVGCSGSNCGPAKGCFHRIAQDRAAKGQIVFVNHALLFSDLSRFLQKPTPLRKFVIDEGHHVERAAVSAWSITLDSLILRSRLTRLLEERAERGLLARRGSFGRRGRRLSDEAVAQLSELRDRIRNLYATVQACFDGLGAALPTEEQIGSAKLRFRHDDRIHQIVVAACRDLLAEWHQLVGGLQTLLRLLQEPNGESRTPRDLLLELRSSLDSATEVGEKMANVLEAANDEWVFWVEAYEGRRGRVASLHGSPISVGAILQKSFWPVADTAALTSATLAADGTFDHCKRSLGLADLPSERLQERVLATPFDLPQQMRILIPVYVPSPRGSSEGWVDAIGDLVTGAVQRYRRGTFVLTTSLDLLSRLAAKLAPVAEVERRTLLVQERDGSPAELLEEFRERRDAVLLGAANFWEGVDVVGEALELLILARLPFDVPTEPWIAARHEKLAEEGKDAFYELSLPEAILRLRQGLGRLIRHRKDRGIAIIADSRVFSTRFGAVIRANLPVAVEAATSPAELWQMCDEFFEDGTREPGAVFAKAPVTGWTKSEP